MLEGTAHSNMVLLLSAYLFLSCLHGVAEATSTYSPRMIFTDKGHTFKRLPLSEHHAPVRILLGDQPDAVTVVGQTHLNFYKFQNPNKTPVEKKVPWMGCSNDCNYNVTVVQQRENTSQVFVCGTNNRETLCCSMSISEQSSMCIPSDKMKNVRESIREFITKEGEHSALVEYEHSADLYMTYSGSQAHVGIHKFGSKRVMPENHDEEQHYSGLVLSRWTDDPSQDRMYAFYKKKNKDAELDSEMWQSFVTQVCLTDVGGPKNLLQFRWTSQMNARLFCGDPESKQHFSELVDTATVYAERWQDTKVFALFRNEWGMSAVCVYTLRDIYNVFTSSSFKGSTPDNNLDRPRMCAHDSTRISSETLRMIAKTSEMEEWVWPVDKSGPLLFNGHNYTHIYVDSSLDKKNSQHTVLFLSLNSGKIHKVLQNENKAFVIAEYWPFNHTSHILNIILDSSSRKLYVNSRHELVQIDVANCAQYGNTCEDCVLSRDPYCHWNDSDCTPGTNNTWPDVVQEDLTRCQSPVSQRHHRGKAKQPAKDPTVNSVTLPSKSKYFLQCQVSSRHAQYTWLSHKSSTNCSSREESCLLLINSMGPEQVGTYQCVSEEMGHRKVLAKYQLQLESRAVSQLSRPVVWVCLMVVLIQLVLTK